MELHDYEAGRDRSTSRKEVTLVFSNVIGIGYDESILIIPV